MSGSCPAPCYAGISCPLFEFMSVSGQTVRRKQPRSAQSGLISLTFFDAALFLPAQQQNQSDSKKRQTGYDSVW